MVRGKKHLCSTFEIRSYFKAFQFAFGEDDNWYKRLENSVVKNHIDEKYQYFLAQPVVEKDTIHWYAKFEETAQRLIELPSDEQEKYIGIKDKTIEHYKSVVDSLKNQDKVPEAEILETSIKHIDDQFIYCFGNKVVLGVWGMKLRDKVKDPFGSGQIAKSVFRKKKEQKDSQKTDVGNAHIQDETQEEPTVSTPPPPLPYYTITFESGEHGHISDETSSFQKQAGDKINQDEIPQSKANNGYDFNGWSEDPNDFIVSGDKTFNAVYKRWPWYKRLWHWFKTVGWKWLLGLILLILLLCLLFKGCSNTEHTRSLPSDVTEKPWVDTDPNTGKGGIYNPGDPYGERPNTPPEYAEILPPNEGALPPLDSSEIIRNPERPTIIGNRLNVLMGNTDKDIKELAKEFKEAYPDDKYKVVYYDNVVKRMQIELPPSERTALGAELPEKFPAYELFVFDESLFESKYTPTDPAYKNPNKSWYLKAINAPQAWDVSKGSKSITIAVVDNGFNLNHPEFKNKVVMPYNVWTHSAEVFPQQIDHGTHVAGTALALMDNGHGLCGVASNASFMPVQVGNQQDVTTITSILDGILYALYQGADVINISMGLEFSQTLNSDDQEKLKNIFKPEERLWNHVMKIADDHNSTIVIAAGNDNILADIDPLKRPENFIVVSAVNKNLEQLEKAKFSNYGKRSIVSAPGVDIYSTVGNGKYQIQSGTSMAAPIVSGAVALMKSLNDTITTQQIACVLKSTGKSAAGNIGAFLQLDKALERVTKGEFEDCSLPTPIPSSGDVQILLSWGNYNDLDLICVDPFGDIVWFENKKVNSGGQLEIDMNVKPLNNSPIENIFWPKGEAPNGTYNVYLLYYENHKSKSPVETNYKIQVLYDGKKEEHKGVATKVEERKHITSFTIGNESEARSSSEQLSSNDRKVQLEIEKRQLQQKLERINKELEQIKKRSKE